MPLPPTEFDLLAELTTQAGRVWSPGKQGNLRVLRTHLMHLRRKLGEGGRSPRYTFAEPRVGYWMPEGEEDSQQSGIEQTLT